MIVAALVGALVLGAVGSSPLSPSPIGLSAAQDPPIVLLDGTLIDVGNWQAQVQIETNSDLPIQIASISVEGMAEDVNPIVAVVTPYGHDRYENGIVPARQSIPEGGRILLIAKFEGPAPEFGRTHPVTVALEDGTTLTIHLELARVVTTRR